MKLIYRAQTYEYTPCPPVQSSRKPCELNSIVKDRTVKLIYRGQGFEYTPPPIHPYRKKPRAMNWRFQMAIASSKSRQKQTGSSETAT